MCNRECNRYNGWKNYETWVYNLHLTNECDPLRFYFEQLSSMNTYEFAQYLENELQDNIDLINNNSPLIADLLSSAVTEINFIEVAMSIMNDYEQENEQE